MTQSVELYLLRIEHKKFQRVKGVKGEKYGKVRLGGDLLEAGISSGGGGEDHSI